MVLKKCVALFRDLQLWLSERKPLATSGYELLGSRGSKIDHSLSNWLGLVKEEVVWANGTYVFRASDDYMELSPVNISPTWCC